jgi:gas vesicle protein
LSIYKVFSVFNDSGKDFRYINQNGFKILKLQNMSTSKTLFGFIAGAAVGAALGILFAPDKGTETRRKISEQSNDLADNIKGKFTDLVDGVKEKFSTIKGEAEDVVDKGYSAYNRKKTEFNS